MYYCTCIALLEWLQKPVKEYVILQRPDISHFIMFDVCNQVSGLLLAPTLIIIADNVTTRASLDPGLATISEHGQAKIVGENIHKTFCSKGYPFCIHHNY